MGEPPVTPGTAPPTDRADPDAWSGRLVVAHRGWHQDGAAENSVAAVEAAYRRGCDAAEVDVRRSSDGQLVLFHDATWYRQPVELCRRAWLPADVLDRALVCALDHRRGLVVDVKASAYLAALWPTLTRRLAALPAGSRHLVTVQSGSVTGLRGLLGDVPGIRASLLTRRPMATLDSAGLWGVSRVCWGLSATRVRGDRAEGLRVLTWTVNRPSRMRQLYTAGVDGLITDRPDLALAVLGRQGNAAAA